MKCSLICLKIQHDVNLVSMDISAFKPSARKSKTAGLILAACAGTGGAAITLSMVCYPFVSPALRRICLPFVPATPAQISNVLQALKGRSGKLLDIGSGDGRIVIAAAKSGFYADGVELNPWLVLVSRFLAFRVGLSTSTSFHRKDLWKFDLSPYKNIVIFGVKEMMEELNKKFEEELIDAQVIACRFPLPSKEPLRVIGHGIDRVWVYSFSKE